MTSEIGRRPTSNGLAGSTKVGNGSANGTTSQSEVEPTSSSRNGMSHIMEGSGQKPVIDITKDLSALISQQMKATPNAIALEDEFTSLTYRQLDQKVSFLASRLRDRGVGRDDLVGVLLGRSANYVIACLAALRSGGAFLV